MYQSTEQQLPLNLFSMHLIKKDDEWIKLTQLIPWFELEKILASLFSDKGRNAIPVRIIIGALIIQTKMTLSDRETVEMISSTPRLQYFLGLSDFDPEYAFDFSLLCKYRQKLGLDSTKEMIDMLLKHHQIIKKVESDKTHLGSLSIDATVVPVNITYPTDLKLLNVVREQSEKLIDELYKASTLEVKPRTHRKKARADYLKYAKKKNMSKNTRFTANRTQLQYIKRNIEIIEKYVNEAIFILNESQKETLEAVKKIYEQQHYMWGEKINKVDDRIVNFHQDHIRGIVRGKAGTKIEFGPKIAVSKVNGYIHLDKISFTNFNEGTTLKSIVEKYKETYGVYPESIRADQIYQTRKNKSYCKDLEIRLSGKPLGRPKKQKDPSIDEVMKSDMKKRIEIEAVFGTAKTKYGLSNLMTKLPDTQKASIGLVFFVMNLMQIYHKVSFSSKLEVAIFMIIDNETAYEINESDLYFVN